MSMTIIDNFSLKGKSFMDGRQSVATLAALKAVPETDIPDGFRAYCTATRLWYEYNSANSVDATLGRWRGINSSTDARTDAKIKAAVTDKLGQPGGIATLGDDGQIPAENLPEYISDTVDLDGFVAGVTATPLNNSASLPVISNSTTWYDTVNKRVLYKNLGNEYYYWAAGSVDDNSMIASAFRRTMAPGGTPLKGKIYVNIAENKIYRWSGTVMVEISKSLALGAVEGTGNVVTNIKVENGVIKPVKSTKMATEASVTALGTRVTALENAEPDSIPTADIVALFA